MFTMPDINSNMTCISIENRQLRFILSQRHSSAIWYCFSKEIEQGYILHIFNEIKAFLRHNAPLDSILALGEIARQQIFPDGFTLEKLNDKDMLIVMSGHDYHFDLLAEGGRFLGIKHHMGRCLLWDTANLRIMQPVNSESNRALLIINPTEDLDEADEEGAAVSELLENAGVHVDCLYGKYASLKDVSIRLNSRNYGLIHYCGHVVQNENGSALALADGKSLSASIIANLKIGADFVFINGCSSNLSGYDTMEGDGRMGIVDALAKTGVSNIIGTITDVPDTLSKEFSLSFYRHFLSGMGIGECVALTKQKLIEAGKTSSLAYTLYGNPKTYFTTQAAIAEPREKAEPAGPGPAEPAEKAGDGLLRDTVGDTVMDAFILSTIVFSNQVVSTYSFAICLAILPDNKFSYLVSEANGSIPALSKDDRARLDAIDIDVFPRELLSPNLLKATTDVMARGPKSFDIALVRELLNHKEYSLHRVFDQLGVDMDFVKKEYERQCL